MKSRTAGLAGERPATASRVRLRLPWLPLVFGVLSLGLVLAGAAVARPGLDLAADDPAARRVLVGFHGVERNASASFRWSEPRATIFVYGFEGRPALVRLRLTAPRPAGTAPPQLDAQAGDTALGSFTVSGDWRHYHLLIPTRPSGESALQLTTTAFLPPGDPRELGVALSRVQASATTSGLALPPVRISFLLALPLLGWLLLARLGAPAALALGTGGLLAGVASWAAAFPSVSGYWLPTLGWPWWPLLPLVLLVAWPWLRPILADARRRIGTQPAVGWAGLAVALAALVGMRLGLPPALGMSLLVGGVWVGSTRAAPHTQTAAGTAAWAAPALVLAGILLIALGLRLFNLDGQPAGLWRDESRHGLQALRIWSDPSYRPIYVVVGADLPALLFYLMAPVVGLLGPHAWSARLVSALAGALTPLALFWAAGPLIGRRAALIGAALVAWASWSLSMSRWAFPATLDHLLVLSAVGLLWRGLDRLIHAAGGPSGVLHKDALPSHAGAGSQRPGLAVSLRQAGAANEAAQRRRALLYLAGAGLLGGLAVYTYHTGRVAPLALAAVAAIRLGPSAAAWRRALPGLAIAALAGALTIAPLAAYILGDLEGYNRRVGRVSILDSSTPTNRAPVALVLDNLGRYLLMFHLRGDFNGRHHMPNAPMLDPLAGLLLALGLGLALPAARRQPGVAAVLALGAIYLIPGVFSGNAPHAMRSLGTLAPAAMLAGLGLAALVPARRPALLAIPLVASLAFNSWLYFGVMRVEPRVYGEFDLVETVMGRLAAAAATSGDPTVRVFIPEDLAGSDTVRFLTWGAPPERYRGAPLPPAGAALVLLPGDASTAAQAAALAALGPDSIALGPVASYPGSERPLVLAFGRGAAAARLVGAAEPSPSSRWLASLSSGRP